MKELKKIKLNRLCKAELNSRELSQLMGGICCGCGCHGSSNAVDNQKANADNGYGGGLSCRCGCYMPSSTADNKNANSGSGY